MVHRDSIEIGEGQALSYLRWARQADVPVVHLTYVAVAGNKGSNLHAP
jgi:hypothetical protein